ncbi:alpha/beta-hydrolase [Fomitopsis serialis]|uniref:alpha/beta-hydrolase n=1 Tax=Fomitopsis serialis TaxID=139415 RepID=UPI0020087503|nr:alpha/beta-hydrolase [Neoantrodia serialis]KAH9916177.1 alpha/beta-hydrolase [Neoantrodia serialis]
MRLLSSRVLQRTANIRKYSLRSHSAAESIAPVNLHYDKLVPKDGNATDRPLVILHGLFGMKRNWLSLSKAFLRDLDMPIYTLDLRNHGTSPHARPMDYAAMAVDVLYFFRRHSLTNVSLLGHSMGGKVAMSVALSPECPPDLKHLIVADISPAKGPLSPEFSGYIEALKKIESSKVTNRKEAQDILKPYEQDAMTRAFLLTNLKHQGHEHLPLEFQIPLEIIGDSIPDIGSFPYEPGERTWEGSTLLIKGTKSKYINDRNIPVAKQFFPNMVLERLEAGHWVHAEKPNEFKHLVTEFIRTRQ